MSGERTYTVAVSLTFRFRTVVDVEARDVESAKALAIDAAECDWSESERVGAEASILPEKGEGS